MSKFCALCGQAIVKGPKRICSLCGNPIKQHHKWRIGPDGRLQHKDCGDPELAAVKVEPQQTLQEVCHGK